LLGSEGARTGWWALHAAIAGVGAAAARRQRWKPNSRGARRREGGTACAGVCTRVRLLLLERRVGVATGCRGGVHSGARLDAMGGGERGARGWLA
jgi:hypothetical protein